MASLIQGIDILLHSGETLETVHNVLVGQPQTSGTADMSDGRCTLRSYTLAIPKGDNHDWADRIVEFFGQTFRTVGYPLMGIETLMPLDWHKQVTVQQLDITGSCTVYEKTNYSRHMINTVYIFDECGTVPEIGAATKKGALNVHIYADSTRSDSYIPRIGDIIAAGACNHEFDISSQESTSRSMKAFRESGVVFGVISEIKTISYGTLPDYIITAR